MKITKVYKNQRWVCYECGVNIKPSEVILSPFPLDVLSKLKRSTKCDFINKKGFLIRTSVEYIKNSNFNRMMRCPKCKGIAYNGFIRCFPPNSKRREPPQYEKRIKFDEEKYYTTTTNVPFTRIIETNNEITHF